MQIQDVMHRQVVTASGHEPLPDTVVKMQLLRVKRLPVVQNGRLVGIVTSEDVSRALPALSERLSPWDFTVRVGRVHARDVMRRPVLSVRAEDDLVAAARAMLQHRVGGLPVLDEDERLVGMLTNTDVLRAMLHFPPGAFGAVREHMTALGDAVAVAPDETLGDAGAKLKVARLKVAPVVEGGRLVGVLHDRDVRNEVARAEAAHGPSVLGERFLLGDRRVRDVMREPLGRVLASVPLREAIEAMLRADVHGLPVLSDGGGLLGVVTVSDVLRALLEGTPASA